jgi:hypothetical protein
MPWNQRSFWAEYAPGLTNEKIDSNLADEEAAIDGFQIDVATSAIDLRVPSQVPPAPLGSDRVGTGLIEPVQNARRQRLAAIVHVYVVI